jgi:hypothetical protein
MFTRRAHFAPWSGLRRLASLPQVALGVKSVNLEGYHSKLWVTLPRGAPKGPNWRVLALLVTIYV